MVFSVNSAPLQNSVGQQCLNLKYKWAGGYRNLCIWFKLDIKLDGVVFYVPANTIGYT